MLGDRQRKVITHYLKNLQEICVNLQVVPLTHSYSFFRGGYSPFKILITCLQQGKVGRGKEKVLKGKNMVSNWYILSSSSKNGAKLLTALKFAIASSLVYVLVIAENYHIAALEKNEIFLRADR